jgi:hypothetical protein
MISAVSPDFKTPDPHYEIEAIVDSFTRQP